MKNKIKIIVPFYNPGKFLDRCVNSLLTQDYDNYEILFIDDFSSDGSFNKIPAVKYKGDENGDLLKDENGEPVIESKHPLLDKTKCKNILAWRSNERVTALPNLHNGIMKFATDPNDIVVIVDGDDWLFNKKVLSYINDFYNKNKECWMMYGSSKWTDNRPCCAREYTEEEFKNLRKAPFKISHIRTFRAGLYANVAEQDFDFNCMKDKNGEWYKMTYDVAMFLPMLEMAGKEHVFYNKTPLYEILNKKPLNRISIYKLEKIESND